MARETLLLASDDIHQLVAIVGRDRLMDQMIERLEFAFRESDSDSLRTPPRAGFITGVHRAGVLEWMPHHEPGRAATIKLVSYAPNNPGYHGLPTILGTLARIDDETGHLLTIADAVLPTAIRTGAASAVATRLLARPGSSTVGLIGAGAQAVTQLHAISRVLDVSEVLVHDVNPDHRRSYLERASFLGLDIREATLEELESRSDVICTATSVDVNAGPVLRGERLKDHVHINAIGADIPGKVEIPLQVLRSAYVSPDHVQQAQREGECQRLERGEIGAALPELCAAPHLAHPHKESRTVFDSTGFALEDHVALDVLIELAELHGIGTVVQLEAGSFDALNPYATPHNSIPGQVSNKGIRQPEVDESAASSFPGLAHRDDEMTGSRAYGSIPFV
ncbi:alanine dehydrogenase [Kitasatospora atroaurantiaca]|uniref:Ornithine cyclodeaminase/alanine dehydrogenase n=1 Tax=Kitasatospora atroaurantiaca TaxID=285545 RepID=A0A561EKT2_9ACTN|nr:ornithine cyclodeaminase family protein [Kitasatospora atroaurantiaca]TWE16211.1 ornithine cyclodeaminase/alanine dehydrogenase [Kitasatospora atroaurantiaca]